MKKQYAAFLFGVLACICITFTACQKEYSLETNISLAAQGTLTDTTTGECLPDSVVGTFYGGVEPGRDTAYVLVQVNVTNTGSYTIYTDIQNGFYFSDSGYFASAGINIIKLKPVGTPILPQQTAFNVTFDSSVCSFTVDVQDSTGRGVGGGTTYGWTFTGPAGSYGGPIDSAYEGDTVILTTPYHYLRIVGATSATGDSDLNIFINFPGGEITTGSNPTTTGAIFGFVTDAGATVIYSASPLSPTVNTVVTITSYDTSTKIVTGTFSGTAQDAGGNTVSITEGTFTAVVQ